jgi:transcriptional regulator with XRE-family HTH domain
VDRDLSFSRRLRRLRKARDLTQAALAQQAFCAVGTIKKIERGARRPSRQLAELLADCLGLADAERADFLAARSVAIETAAATRGNVATQPATAQRHAKLPHQPTPLVGRAAELSALNTLFADTSARLITIVGSGGMGKTRLAIALAEQLVAAGRFHDGACFVPLAPLDAVERIVHAPRTAAAVCAGKARRRAR